MFFSNQNSVLKHLSLAEKYCGMQASHFSTDGT